VWGERGIGLSNPHRHRRLMHPPIIVGEHEHCRREVIMDALTRSGQSFPLKS